jgi:radical SAM superfamily enzyme YgiQ (UPF0313 family)
VRLLLVNPRFPESFWTFRWAVQDVLPGKRTVYPPLGLATLAALCPADWEIDIVDENVESVPLAPQADLIGVCGMGVQYPRQKELLAYYRSKGYRVVAGGSFASLCPERYTDHADFVVAGESEYVWPQFCRDFAAGTAQPLYRESGTVELKDSPVPRFDLLKMPLYTAASLQFSRGCPFRCEFCDIIVMFGRRPRVKTHEQVGRELDALRAQGVRRVFFVDDNLIGNKPQAKALLRFLARYQEQHGYRFSFGTEASLNLAHDDELLVLFRDAGFAWVFIGIESPDEASLMETKKTQNVGGDMLADVRRIYAHGIDVLAGFIIGFDHDTLDTFERQHDFIQRSGIASAMIGLLNALPRTPLYERLQKEGRLREHEQDCDNTRLGTNIVPKGMPYDEMVLRYQQLYRRLLSDRGIAERINHKMRFMRDPAYTGAFPLRDTLLILWRLLVRGLLPGGPRRLYHFARTLPLRRPDQLPMVVGDWITGLSMADFARRHFDSALQDQRVVSRHLEGVGAWFAEQLGSARVAVGMSAGAPPRLWLSLDALLDRSFFSRAAAPLEQLLRTTRASLTLRIESLPTQQLGALQRLLRRLARYGDRISIELDETLRGRVPIDSSVFHLVLSGQRPAARS